MVRLELVSKSLKQKLCLSIQFNILYLLCHLVTLILDLCTSALRVRAHVRVHFPATYFLYFVALFAQTPFLFFVKKKKTLNAKTLSCVRAWACLLRFTGLSVDS